ncbi:glycine betaine ABC transporter substrate-binding protein [Alteromonas lipotrueae]|uniref:glycine betaine ABC transporter substrate-binding protein n=1 Tax=Alteromonas lipotrueae TaxID=2803814 RepID=UPI001C478C4F|nr:glycine betaine ABC transporter substrate-binding protein [Alteromonas lipotrueae]
MKSIVKIGVTNLSFHHVAASLVSNVLNSMGFDVQRIYSPHETNFEKLKSGDVDLLASAWLPSSHGVYKANVEEVISLTELGLHYEPYALWGVPDYIPESAVSEVTDLLKPSVIEKMNANIQGINPGAGITRFSIKMMEEYGLSNVGYKFHTGTEEDCFTAFEKQVEKEDWFVVPLWKPQFLHFKHKIREIKDPKGLLGVVDRAVLLIRDDKKQLLTKAQLNKLNALRFNNDVIAELDYHVSRNNKPIDDVTKAWLVSNEIIPA